ncbi:MAG: hypothetical protein DRP13_03775 [Candidatus Aenigmatarchaeota archaeon]|nr:MAG: hypothetical protein DRP16_04165 [Candidatus Aenigmarchaeota archaeon]RLJ07514.1 MAG: hypothetical protein DRP13_03775 [Candidatus Aenigmarchaeota archaeon]
MMLLSRIFGFQRKVRKLRKTWDRLREKSLKKKNPIREMALERLDAIENHLRMLEEQKLSKIDRARISKEVEIDLEEVKALLEMEPEDIRHPAYTQKA